MLEKDSWSYPPPYDILFPDTFDNECIGEMSNLAFKDSSKVSGHESSYLSYEGWPDTGGFDELFRFGQGNATNGDEMSWFSSPDTSESIFSETSALTILKHHGNDIYPASNTLLPHSDQNIVPTSYTNCVGANGERKPQLISGMQPDRLRRKLLKNHEQTEGKREDQTSKYASDGSFLIPVTAQQFANPTERSSDSSQNVITLTTEQNTNKLQWNCQMQDFSSNKFQQEDLVNHSAFTEQVPLHTQLHQTQDGVKGHCRVEKVITEHPNLDTDASVILDCSVISSAGSNKISVEETSFRKLHYVLEQLDIRTKLCIRDSLYRLAKSAEQRQVMGHPSGNIGDKIDKSGLVATEESVRFVDMETDTNPIDRSIAHLLFHRPNGRMSFESHITPAS